MGSRMLHSHFRFGARASALPAGPVEHFQIKRGGSYLPPSWNHRYYLPVSQACGIPEFLLWFDIEVIIYC
jgi:hypothetical protein